MRARTYTYEHLLRIPQISRMTKSPQAPPTDVMAVTVVIAPFFAVVIVTTWLEIRPRSLGDVILMVLVGLFSIGVRIGCLQQLANHTRRLPVELRTQLGVMIKTPNKHRDDLAVIHVGDGKLRTQLVVMIKTLNKCRDDLAIIHVEDGIPRF